MLKIILTGPESSGKTTLAHQLAMHFNAPLVEEYARVFFEKKETPQYKQEDLVEIAKGQLNNELKIINGELPITHHLLPITHHPSPMLICDTDLLTIKIWSNEVFGNCNSELTQLIDNQLVNYLLPKPPNPSQRDAFGKRGSSLIAHHPSPIISYYFLCTPKGIEWEDDPLRENPHDRDRLFKIYEKELKFYEKKYSILRGSENERFDKAVTKINRLLKNPV